MLSVTRLMDQKPKGGGEGGGGEEGEEGGIINGTLRYLSKCYLE